MDEVTQKKIISKLDEIERHLYEGNIEILLSTLKVILKENLYIITLMQKLSKTKQEYNSGIIGFQFHLQNTSSIFKDICEFIYKIKSSEKDTEHNDKYLLNNSNAAENKSPKELLHITKDLLEKGDVSDVITILKKITTDDILLMELHILEERNNSNFEDLIFTKKDRDLLTMRSNRIMNAVIEIHEIIENQINGQQNDASHSNT
jgi:hypothetical protein